MTTLIVAYITSNPRLEDTEDETLEQTRKRSKWNNGRGHILNEMKDSLVNVYQFYESKKLLWDALEDKYMVEDTSSKKFLVSKYNSYKMVDNRLIIDQFHELQKIHANIKLHDINLDEIFIVSNIIDKLSSS